MDPKWFAPEGRPLQASGRHWLAFGSVCLGSMLLPPGKIRIGLAAPALLYLASRSRSTSSGKPEEDYLSLINMALVGAKWIDFVALGRPERDLHRVDMTKESMPSLDEDVQTMTIWQKFKWSFSFWTSFRGCGWNWQVKNVHQKPLTVTKRAFLLQQVFSYLKCHFVLDFSTHYLLKSPWGTRTNVPDIFLAPFWQQVLLGWVQAVNAGVGMSFAYHLCAFLSVASGTSAPQDWPDPFGSLRKGYTVRKIWGYCWHQNLRQLFTSTTNAINHALRIRKGSLLSRYSQLYGAFFVSACVHHIGALNLPYTPAARCQFFFFLIQPVAITVEDTVVYLGKRCGIKENVWTKAAGFAWVFCFLSWSLRYMCAMGNAMGGGAVRHPLIWSVADRLL